MRQLVDEGMPRFGHGLYPLKACVQWYIKFWEDRALSREGDLEKNKSRALQNALLEAKVAESTGHLISRVEIVMAVSSAFQRLGKAMDNVGTALARELNWNTDTVRIVRARHDDMRKNFVRDCGEFIDVVEEKAPARPTKKRA